MLATLFPDWQDGTVQISMVNAFLSWGAGMAHIYGAVNTSGWLRRMFLLIAGLALFYSLAYWWLVWNPTRGTEWSEFLRPWAVFTWVIAWGIEPIVLVRYLGKRSRFLIQQGHDQVQKSKLEGLAQGLEEVENER